MSTQRERRRKERYPAEQVFAAVTIIGGCDQGLGLIMDVSESGVMLRTTVEPPSSGRLILRVVMDEDPHEFEALIRRVVKCCDSPHMWDVGLQFGIGNTEGRRHFLESFTARMRAGADPEPAAVEV